MNMVVKNPFTPSAGHYPPFLAGRNYEIEHCKQIFQQESILKNLIITGLRGLGKTVLLEAIRPIATEMGWGWCGTDMSESASVTEESMAVRILTDMSLLTSNLSVLKSESRPDKLETENMDFNHLTMLYEDSPGLVSDRLKSVFRRVWEVIKANKNYKGIVFSYDEVQVIQDHAKKDQYPLSVLLDLFQSIQKDGVRFLLILTGLPTLMPKLIQTRTYTERMFETIFLVSRPG